MRKDGGVLETNDMMNIFYICLAAAVFFLLLVLLVIFIFSKKKKKTEIAKPPIQYAEQQPESAADNAVTRRYGEPQSDIAAPSAKVPPAGDIKFEIVKKVIVCDTDEVIE